MSGLKSSNYYPLKFKLQVIDEVLSGKISKEAARKKYGIKGNSTIIKWIRKLDIESIKMAKNKDINYEKRIKELEALLEFERMKRIAAEEMITIAEEQLKINIRKKSDTKQSKR